MVEIVEEALEKHLAQLEHDHGRATTVPCVAEDSSRRENLPRGGSKEGFWVYTGPEPGTKMEIPDNEARGGNST